MLTTFELDEYVFEALRLGASGFLLKDAEPARLLDGIRIVADGGSLLAPSVTRRVIEHYASMAGTPTVESHPHIDDLTDRVVAAAAAALRPVPSSSTRSSDRPPSRA